MIESELEAFLPFVIDIRESHQVTRDFAGRIVAAVFTNDVNARQIERHNRVRLVRRQVPFQVQEFLVRAAGQPPHEHLGIEVQHGGKLRHAIDCCRNNFRVCPDAVDRRTDRQRLAISIRNGSAVRGNPFGSQVAGIRLLIQEVLVKHLQVHCARNQRYSHHQEKDYDQ